MPFSIIMQRPRAGGEEQTEVKEVAGSVLRIGRSADNDLQLDDDAVRPAHAAIQEVGGAYILRDLGDGTQTLVNDKPVKEAILTAKGTIRIGSYLLEFARAAPTAPLRIAGTHFTSPPRDDPDRTLVVPPVQDPDATMVLRGDDDPDKTRIIPPPGAPPS